VLPHEVAKSGTTDGLSVDLAIDAVLVGLQPVYSHGLQVGLTAAGLSCTTVRTAEEYAGPTGSGRTVVAVVRPGTDPTVDAWRGAPVAVVHVLAEASALAYSDALRAGATGAFPHEAELADVVRVVLCAGLGLTLLPLAVARALNRPSSGSRPQLTSRDLQYLRMLADGATVASVGRRFAHSEREMYRLLSETYQRLGARNRTEALLLAQRFDLLEEQP
jgi:DNA-binding NarL/FixJ family response regulator